MKLSNEYTMEEKEILTIWKDSNLMILDSINVNCYILSYRGNLSYYECFGETESKIEKSQKYVIANPSKVIRFYNYYLLEDKGKLGQWYVGEKNGDAIEFYKCCENLEYAFDSL